MGKKSSLWETLTKEKLYEEYIVRNRTKADIGKDYGVSGSTIMRIAKSYGLEKTEEQRISLGKEKCIEKYGVENPFSREDIKEKIKQTNLRKYGVENPSQNEDIKEKKIETFKSNYGVSNIFQLEETKEKIKQTNLKKYGVENPNQNKDILLKRQKTLEERYGVIYPKQKNKLTTSVFSSEETAREFLSKEEYYKKPIPFLSKELGYSYCQLLRYIKKFNLEDLVDLKPSRSQYEDEIVDFLKQLGIKNIEINKKGLFNDKREIDIFLPDYKLGIEFNGTFWHSDAMKPKNYHYKKSLDFLENGYELIHIYEYEWTNNTKKEIIKSLLKIRLGFVDERIYARNCEIKEIKNSEAKEFNNKNHIQGHRPAKITYGLFYKGKLVQLMSFSKHSKYEWEIIRGCPGSNNIVIGGVDKLFKYFIKKNNPTKIFSYCDFNKFNGKSYEKIGMDFIGYTGPDKKIILDGNVINRKPTKYKEFKDKLEGSIYGAGSKKYLWKKEKESE